MSDFNTNLTDRSPPRLAPNIVEIFLESDFPDAVSGKRPLAANTTYLICGSITTADQLTWPEGFDCEIKGGYLGAELIYTGTVGFIVTDTHAGNSVFRLNGVRIEITEDDAYCFDISSESGGVMLIKNCRFFFTGEATGLGFLNEIIFDLEDIFLNNPTAVTTFFGAGAIMQNVTAVVTTGDDLGGEALFQFTGAGSQVTCRTVNTALKEDDAIFRFDATMTGPLIIDDCGDADPANVPMFQTEDDVAVTSFADNGGGLVRVVTSAVHGFTSGDNILVKNSVLYHGGFEITVINTTTFDLLLSSFSADDTQPTTAVNGGSLTEMDSRVAVTNSGDYKPSQTIGAIYADGNTTDTNITGAGTFANVALDSSPTEPSDNQERFIMGDADIGEIVYVGANPRTMLVRASLTARLEAGAGALDCLIRLLQNGSVLPDPTGLDFAGSWNVNNPNQIQGEWVVEAVPDDVFRIQVANVETDEDIGVEQLSLTIR